MTEKREMKRHACENLWTIPNGTENNWLKKAFLCCFCLEKYFPFQKDETNQIFPLKRRAAKIYLEDESRPVKRFKFAWGLKFQ